MKRLIIIGNGFDLAHGVKTSYKDFIEWYFKERIKGFENNHTKIDKDCLCEFNIHFFGHTWHTAQTINLINFNYDIAEFLRSLKKKKEEYNVVFSSLFDRIIKNIENKGWVDIERDYYELLKESLKIQDNEEQIKECIELNKQLSFLQEKLIEYLSEVNRLFYTTSPMNDSSFESSIKEIMYAPIDENGLTDRGKKCVREHIAKSKDIGELYMSKKLNDYGYVFPIKNSVLNEIKEYFKIKNSSIPKELLLPDEIMLLNFNYTTIADKYIIDNEIFKINHIHGNVSDENSVIFGYGDELDVNYKEIEELNSNEFLNKIKSVKYLEANNYKEILSFVDSEPFEVYVIGHSCGNSDRTLLNKIFEHENCISIKPFYYTYNKEGKERDNFTEIVQNITRSFKDKQLLKERVVSKVYCQVLPQSIIKHSMPK